MKSYLTIGPHLTIKPVTSMLVIMLLSIPSLYHTNNCLLVFCLTVVVEFCDELPLLLVTHRLQLVVGIIQSVIGKLLIIPELNLTEADISTSHRLPTNKESLKSIIAKFVRGDTRDAIYKKKRNLSSKTSQDIGFHHNTKLCINESLTAGSRSILNKAK